MPPTSKELTGILVWVVRLSRTVHARIFKFHILWIPHGKIADPYFFSCLSYLPFWSKISQVVFELGA